MRPCSQLISPRQKSNQMESKIRTPNPPPSRSRSRSERKPREQGDELIARTSSLISNYRAFDLFTTAAGEEDLRKVLAQWREETDESKRSSDAWDILNAYFESAPFVCVDREREGVDGGAVERFAHYVNVMQMLKEFIHSCVFDSGIRFCEGAEQSRQAPRNSRKDLRPAASCLLIRQNTFPKRLQRRWVEFRILLRSQGCKRFIRNCRKSFCPCSRT